MQTFLPYPDFRTSLGCLDTKRLGKQRVEAMQLVNALERGNGAWFNHPAAKMWVGHIASLKVYMNESILEWTRKGFRNTMSYVDPGSFYIHPWWFGNEEFHASHRSNLLRKDPVHYGQFGWKEPNDLPYLWPDNETKTFRIIK